LALGGKSVFGEALVAVGAEPGRYEIQLKVRDLIADRAIGFKYDIQVSKPDFGLIQILAPTVGLPGQTYTLSYVVAHASVDNNKKMKLDVTTHVRDQAGKIVSRFETTVSEPGRALQMRDVFVPNRPGAYTVELTVRDVLAKKTTDLRYPLKVLDLTEYTERVEQPEKLPTPRPAEEARFATPCPPVVCECPPARPRLPILRRLLCR